MDDIDRIRAFSRIYTGKLGLLARSYLGSGLGMTEARILHDLDQDSPTAPRLLAQSLGLDEGYLSRTLAGFVRQGWVARAADSVDARRRPVQLTAAGREMVARLRVASREAIAAAVAPTRRPALADALDRAGAILEGRDTASRLRALVPGDAGWVVERHGAVYARDEGYGPAFEALVARIMADFLEAGDQTRQRGWIAESADGQRIGCIFCVAESDEVARLRLFYLEPEARGTGLAQRMVEECFGFAKTVGYRHMVLWTHESHRAAGRLYARNGFTLTSAVAAQAFGQDVVDQTWERALD